MNQRLSVSFLLIALLLVGGVLAASLREATYIVAVDDKAPASDVVVAANFAASMKATTGRTYQSALASELSTISYSGKTIVIIDGTRQSITSHGTDDAAVAYFRAIGWRVEEGAGTVAGNERDDTPPTLEDDKENDKTPVDVETAPNEADDSTPVPQVIVESPHPEPEEKPVPEPTPASEPDAAPPGAEEDESSFFGKIWRWFADLF